MHVLYVHQNFPAQYRHLAAALAGTAGYEVAAIADAANASRGPAIPGVKLLAYRARGAASAATHHYVRPLEGHVRRGQEALLGEYLARADVSGTGEWRTARIHVADPRSLKRLVARSGGAVEIVGPSEAAAAAVDWARAGLAQYG